MRSRLQRRAQRRLVLGGPADECAPVAGLASGEGEQENVEVGVGVLVVGLRVVAIVLAHPPAVTDADEATEGPAEPVIGVAPVKDLPVPGVVAEKRELCVHHGKEHGDSELPPGVAYHDKRDAPASEGEEGEPDLDRVVAVPPAQKTRRAHLSGELTVVVVADRPRPA